MYTVKLIRSDIEKIKAYLYWIQFENSQWNRETKNNNKIKIDERRTQKDRENDK